VTDTAEPRVEPDALPREGAVDAPRGRAHALRVGMALACALLGFLLVTQVRAGEELGRRLETEREEDLARILADLSTQSDKLQLEIAELRLTLLAFENNAADETLALRTLERRLADLRILAGTVPAQGKGLLFTVSDSAGTVTQELLVDTVQELRDAGAEAIAVNGVRLVASSAFTTRNDRLLVDGQPLDPPYKIAAIGASDTMAKALAIPGGAIDALELQPGVDTSVELLAQLTVPARAEAAPFVFGRPVTTEPGE
jgi:uncharacterized protein YlxW (UPF0749 family)